MRRPRTLIALVSAGLLTLAAIAPAAAADESGTASGWVKWRGESGETPIRISAFSVVDGTPGVKSDVGDSGWYFLSQRRGTDHDRGTLLLDVSCVRVDGDWAKLAGVATRTSGVYEVGSVWVVLLYDSGKRGVRGDEIGMQGRWDPDEGGLADACRRAVNKHPNDESRLGVIKRGNIRVSDPS